MILISHYQHIRNIGVIFMFLLINVGSLMNVKEQVHSRFTASLPVYCTNALENCDLDLHYNLDLTFPLCSSPFQRNSSTYFIHISHSIRVVSKSSDLVLLCYPEFLLFPNLLSP